MARYVKFPGTAGSYASTDDVNLLDADTAHLQQSNGLWSNPTLSQAVTPVFGDSTGLGTAAGSVNVITSAAESFPIASSTEYTFSYWAQTDVADRFSTAVVNQYDAVGAQGSTLTSTETAITIGSWTQITLTFTSDSDAASCRFLIRLVKVGNVAADIGDLIYIDATCLRTGSDAAFVPSLRIVGVTEYTAKFSMADYTPTSNTNLFGRLAAAGANRAHIYKGAASGNWIAHFNGTFLQWSPTGLVDGSLHDWRWVLDPTGGSEMFIDAVSLGSLGATYTPAFSVDVDNVGQDGLGNVALEGDVFFVTKRDGVGGPIVAIFDADDVPAI